MSMTRLVSLALAAALAVAPALADQGKNESGKSETYEQRQGKDRDKNKGYRDGAERGNYFEQHGYTRIPNGHLPPPGECRLWYPDRPPGHQPPPFRCGGAAPAGAWVLKRPPGASHQVEAVVYDVRQPGVVVSVGLFDANTGAFVRLQASSR